MKTYKCIHAPGSCPLPEQGFGLCPYFLKEFTVSVIFQILSFIPAAVRKKYCRILFILIEFQKSTAREIPDFLLYFLKNRKKNSSVFFFEFHFYNSCKHVELWFFVFKINAEAIPQIQSEKTCCSAN